RIFSCALAKTCVSCFEISCLAHQNLQGFLGISSPVAPKTGHAGATAAGFGAGTLLALRQCSMRTQHYPGVVIGAGQAGLSMSYCLHERGIAHVVLEKHRIAHAWRSQRWDNF